MKVLFFRLKVNRKGQKIGLFTRKRWSFFAKENVVVFSAKNDKNGWVNLLLRKSVLSLWVKHFQIEKIFQPSKGQVSMKGNHR